MTQGPDQADKPEGPTDETNRPSVWPVYVSAGTLLLLSLALLWWAGPDLLVGLRLWAGGTGHAADVLGIVLFPLYCVFGCIAAFGLLRLRRWAWWCAATWTVLFLVWGGAMAGVLLRDAFLESNRLPGPAGAMAAVGLFLVTLFLLLRPMISRRRLFFPAKPPPDA